VDWTSGGGRRKMSEEAERVKRDTGDDPALDAIKSYQKIISGSVVLVGGTGPATAQRRSQRDVFDFDTEEDDEATMVVRNKRSATKRIAGESSTSTTVNLIRPNTAGLLTSASETHKRSSEEAFDTSSSQETEQNTISNDTTKVQKINEEVSISDVRALTDHRSRGDEADAVRIAYICSEQLLEAASIPPHPDRVGFFLILPKAFAV